MPELPEVETIRRGLERLLIGYRISDIEIRYNRIFSGEPTHITHTSITAVRRFGKGLLIDFANNFSLAVHVKMTGQLIFKSDKTVKEFHPKLPLPLQLPDKHTHVIFKLQSQSEKQKTKEAVLFYNDIRKFGWLKVVKTNEADRLPFFKNLGLEPLSNLPAGRQGLTIKQFNTLVQKSNAPIKSLIMDQSKIAGVGNIYANDALYAAGIDPRRKANSLKDAEIKKLLEAIELVLQKGIDAGGASDVNYLNAEGGKGSYQNQFLVYRQTGKPCQKCGTTIERIKLAGRGTFYCPVCQH